jgi:hypothetical protein
MELIANKQPLINCFMLVVVAILRSFVRLQVIIIKRACGKEYNSTLMIICSNKVTSLRAVLSLGALVVIKRCACNKLIKISLPSSPPLLARMTTTRDRSRQHENNKM